jgi:predicted esterase
MNAKSLKTYPSYTRSRRLGLTGAVTFAFAFASGCVAPEGDSTATVDASDNNNPAKITMDNVLVQPPPFPSSLAGNVTCFPIQTGTNWLIVNGLPRAYEVQLPNDTSNMALLFQWKGWLQAAKNFASTIVYDVPSGKWVPFDPNGFNMPLMIVTPHDRKLIPPFGLDWDIDGSGTVDFPYFEGILKCVDQQFKIDRTRVYSFGFSAGAVFSNLLSAQYPQLFAATISESGTWFNDQAEWKEVLVPIIPWTWPAFNAADGGNILMTHGGPHDFATIISLENANKEALPFLYANGRTVTECAHTFGHTLDPDLTMDMYYEYMWAHQLGGPPLTGLFPDWPTPAAPVGATQCWFHPAP